MASYRTLRRLLVLLVFGCVAVFGIVNALLVWKGITEFQWIIGIEAVITIPPLYWILKKIRDAQLAMYPNKPVPSDPLVATDSVDQAHSRYSIAAFMVIFFGAFLLFAGVVTKYDPVSFTGLACMIGGLVWLAITFIIIGNSATAREKQNIATFTTQHALQPVSSSEGMQVVDALVRTLFTNTSAREVAHYRSLRDANLEYGDAMVFYRDPVNSKNSHYTGLSYWIYTFQQLTFHEFCMVPSDHQLPPDFHDSVATESAEFNNAVQVYTKDQRPAGDVLSPEVMALYLDSTFHPWILCTQTQLMMVVEDPEISVQFLQQALDFFTQLHTRLEDNSVIEKHDDAA